MAVLVLSDLMKRDDIVIIEDSGVINAEALRSHFTRDYAPHVHGVVSGLGVFEGRVFLQTGWKGPWVGLDRPFEVFRVKLAPVKEPLRMEYSSIEMDDEDGPARVHSVPVIACPVCGRKCRGQSLEGWYSCGIHGWVHPDGRLEKVDSF